MFFNRAKPWCHHKPTGKCVNYSSSAILNTIFLKSDLTSSGEIIFTLPPKPKTQQKNILVMATVTSISKLPVCLAVILTSLPNLSIIESHRIIAQKCNVFSFGAEHTKHGVQVFFHIKAFGNGE